MTLKEMAEGYYLSAEQIRQREEEIIKLMDAADTLEKAEHFRMRKRAALLRSMWREMKATSVYIDKYYERKRKARGYQPF